MPKHQRCKELLKAKKTGSERNIDYLERLRKMFEVAGVEKMTLDEIGMHIVAENVDLTITKLALDDLSEEVPTITKLKHKVRSTEVSKWYNTNKNYDKAAMVQKDKHCTTCNSKTQPTSKCWGPCSYCGRYN